MFLFWCAPETLKHIVISDISPPENDPKVISAALSPFKFIPVCVQCRQTYFKANETTMNRALTIVFVQKFHRKILDFCIFEKLSKFFIYQPQNRSLKSSLFSILLDSPRGVLCEIGVSHSCIKSQSTPLCKFFQTFDRELTGFLENRI